MDFSRYQGPLAVALRRFLQPGPPDPWSREVDEAVRRPEAHPICPNGLRPQNQHFWFCAHCGFPGGDCLTMMPYLQNYSLGEVLRRGVIDSQERRKGVLLGFVMLSSIHYLVFAPIYWFGMYRKATGHPICEEKRPRFADDEPVPGMEADDS